MRYILDGEAQLRIIAALRNELFIRYLLLKDKEKQLKGA